MSWVPILFIFPSSNLSTSAISAFMVTRWLLKPQHLTITRIKSSQSKKGVSRKKTTFFFQMFSILKHFCLPLTKPRLGHLSIVRLNKEEWNFHNWHRISMIREQRTKMHPPCPTLPNKQNKDSVYMEGGEMTINHYLQSSLTAWYVEDLKESA